MLTTQPPNLRHALVAFVSTLVLVAGCGAPTQNGADVRDSGADAGSDGGGDTGADVATHPIACTTGTITVQILCPMGRIGACEGGTNSASVDDAGRVDYICCSLDNLSTQATIPAECQPNPTCECLGRAYFGDTPTLIRCDGCQLSLQLE